MDVSTNSKVWEIKELSQAIKNTIENSFEFVKIKGEISKPSFPSSGHIYFSLKDETSLINATIWKWSLANIGLIPEEGLEVICSGKLTTYPGRSSYQINISKIEHAGEGALLKQLEERKKKYFSEGYFNEDLKKKIPSFPKCIGVITSMQGAVIEDILETIQDRWPCKVVIYSVPVQGVSAASKICKGIEYFNSIENDQRSKPDTLIIARGGGSVEDLWTFNEEIIIKSVFNSIIPIVSAIGHETDTTLIDYASDVRAPTPTKAAVLVTPNKEEVKLKLVNFKKRIQHNVLSKIEEKSDKVLFQIKVFDKLDSFLYLPNQRLDLKIKEKNYFIDNLLSSKNLKFLSLKSSFGSPEQLFSNIDRKVDTFFNQSSNLIDKKINSYRLNFLQKHNIISPRIIYSLIEIYSKDIDLNCSIIKKNLEKKVFFNDEKLKNLIRLLNNSNLSKIFDKGFVYLENESGKKVTKLQELLLGESINLTFSDGKAKSKIVERRLN